MEVSTTQKAPGSEEDVDLKPAANQRAVKAVAAAAGAVKRAGRDCDDQAQQVEDKDVLAKQQRCRPTKEVLDAHTKVDSSGGKEDITEATKKVQDGDSKNNDDKAKRSDNDGNKERKRALNAIYSKRKRLKKKTLVAETACRHTELLHENRRLKEESTRLEGLLEQAKEIAHQYERHIEDARQRRAFSPDLSTSRFVNPLLPMDRYQALLRAASHNTGGAVPSLALARLQQSLRLSSLDALSAAQRQQHNHSLLELLPVSPLHEMAATSVREQLLSSLASASPSLAYQHSTQSLLLDAALASAPTSTTTALDVIGRGQGLTASDFVLSGEQQRARRLGEDDDDNSGSNIGSISSSFGANVLSTTTAGMLLQGQNNHDDLMTTTRLLTRRQQEQRLSPDNDSSTASISSSDPVTATAARSIEEGSDDH